MKEGTVKELDSLEQARKEIERLTQDRDDWKWEVKYQMEENARTRDLIALRAKLMGHDLAKAQRKIHRQRLALRSLKKGFETWKGVARTLSTLLEAAGGPSGDLEEGGGTSSPPENEVPETEAERMTE